MEKFLLWTMLLIMTGFGYVTYVDGVSHTSSGCLRTDQNSTMNTVYKENLRTLLDSLAKNVPLQNRFFNTSVGNGSDKVYGLAWCRGDISPSSCSDCLKNTTTTSLRDCPESKELTTWRISCSISFSNESLSGMWYDYLRSYDNNSGFSNPNASGTRSSIN